MVLDAYLQTAGLVISLIGSAGSLVMTCWFWLVRSNRERPCLEVSVAPSLTRVELGVHRETERYFAVHLGLVVANHSSQPNSLLGIRASLRLRDGGRLPLAETLAWQPLPLNVPPLSTAAIETRFTLRLPVDEQAEDRPNPPHGITEGYLERYFGMPGVLEVSVEAMGGRVFRSDAPFRPDVAAGRPAQVRLAA